MLTPVNFFLTQAVFASGCITFVGHQFPHSILFELSITKYLSKPSLSDITWNQPHKSPLVLHESTFPPLNGSHFAAQLDLDQERNFFDIHPLFDPLSSPSPENPQASSLVVSLLQLLHILSSQILSPHHHHLGLPFILPNWHSLPSRQVPADSKHGGI